MFSSSFTVARPFAAGSGKAAFGQLKEPLLASEYLQRKKQALIGVCGTNCDPTELDSKFWSFNRSNLQSTLVMQQNLAGVTVLTKAADGSTPVFLSPKDVPFLDYVIDPTGALFGQSVCGPLNYTSYAELPPGPEDDLS